VISPGKPRVVVTTAIAGEMVRFIWPIACIAQPALAGSSYQTERTELTGEIEHNQLNGAFSWR
jgi:hypothetical protein